MLGLLSRLGLRVRSRRRVVLAAAMALPACVFPAQSARAQRAVDVQVGSWQVPGPDPMLYSAGFGRRFWGPLGYNLRGLAVVDRNASAQSLYGLGPEISLFRGWRVFVPYVVGGVGLGVQPTSSPEFTALWYAGIGVEWNPLSWLGLAAEGSYLAEDSGFQGFWDLPDDARKGWVGSVRVAFRWGGASSDPVGRGATNYPPGSGPSEPGESVDDTGELLDDAAAATLNGRVVQTALGAMGEPYRWGGTSTDQGFDCSGLVWYAYTTHGVSVPRVSRDQARAGHGVPVNITTLEPGDILLFANGGDDVTHVGLYVGNARFIHATNSGGVRVGVLDGSGDGNDRWWSERWVGARRVLE